jgi:uncharacterized NAD-dependent epimerase/dehydratase family protein
MQAKTDEAINLGIEISNGYSYFVSGRPENLAASTVSKWLQNVTSMVRREYKATVYGVPVANRDPASPQTNYLLFLNGTDRNGKRLTKAQIAEIKGFAKGAAIMQNQIEQGGF